jgi:glycosyltransferase involved in cell wall biosynthesis
MAQTERSADSIEPYVRLGIVARMRIVFVSDWFAEKMGYAENCLPKAVAKLGHEVHLITSNVQPYFDQPMYKETYEPFIGPAIVPCGVKPWNGFTLHRLPYGRWRGRQRIQGLIPALATLSPEIVQTFDSFGLTTYETALAKIWLGYKLFHESHVHASVFSPVTDRLGLGERLKWSAYATLGRFVGVLSEKCYPISVDAAEIVTHFFGFPHSKTTIQSLGVDTDSFRPIASDADQQARARLRAQLGFAPEQIVCVYTGRFSDDKGPRLLAQAIAQLAAHGEPFRGLFVGNGTRSEVESIRACPGCVIHPFVPVHELPPFYRAADIGVWPRQESTSQLDAAACGLPIIVSDRVQVRERIEGNGLFYEEGNADDLARQIRKLANAATRRELGELGARKLRERFSWDCIASERMRDYEIALAKS